MAESLFPVIDVPELVDDDGLYDEKYRSSVKWDMEKGDFVQDGSNRMVECDGADAYRVWCIKSIETERYACLAYPDEIGSEMESALLEKDILAGESAVERTITETLLTNPRTRYVKDFKFTRNGEQMCCSFVVKGVDLEEFALSVKLKGGEDG